MNFLGTFYMGLLCFFIGISQGRELLKVNRNREKDRLTRSANFENAVFLFIYCLAINKGFLRKEILYNPGNTAERYPLIHAALFDWTHYYLLIGTPLILVTFVC